MSSRQGKLEQVIFQLECECFVEIKNHGEGQLKKSKRWVIKAGSQLVIDGGPLLIRTWMKQISDLKKLHNIEVIWVTSGAIASAAQRTNFTKSNRKLEEKQALSAIGQPLVMDQYNLALQANQLLGAQVLLTAGDIKDSTRKKNLQNTLNQLLKWNVIPILNENDAVATEEIKFGDNDSLAASVAIMMKAERMILLTDVDGLFDKDPKKFPDAKLIHYRKKISTAELKLAKPKAKSKSGTGGMFSKLLAAERAQKAKIMSHLVRGDLSHNLLHLAEGKTVGTRIGGPDVA